jgi:hypothetical protein
MGVVIETPREVLGLGERGAGTVMHRTQPEGAPDARLERLAGDDSLPDGPARRRIEDWSIEAHLNGWRWGT